MLTIIDPALKDGVIDNSVVNIHELIRLSVTFLTSLCH